MATTLPDIAPQVWSGTEESSSRVETPRPRLKAAGAARPVLPDWLRAQTINVNRHSEGLRPLRREEFVTGAAAPSEGHIQVVNDLIARLRRGLLKKTKDVSNAVGVATREPSSP